MPVGLTSTGTLDNSIPTIIAEAIRTREYAGVMPNLVERQTLGEGTGTIWNEVKFAQLTAQEVTEIEEVDNPQQLSDTLFTITPSGVVIQTLITDRVAERISKNALAQTGMLAQEAIERKKDIDGLTTLDSATTSLGGASTTLTTGYVSAAMVGVQGNTTEPGPPPYRFVHHPVTMKDIQDEIMAGLGTYPIDSGLTASVFANGFKGMIFDAQTYSDGNLTIASNAAKGGIFSQRAIVLVQASAPDVVMVRKEHIGLGATLMIHRDEYAYGIRNQNWIREMHFDATFPTS